MAKISIELITPERVVFSQEADSITIPTKSGEITVLPGHVPLVSTLASGALTIMASGTESNVAVGGGFIEVLPGSKILVLADFAERAEELDLEAVEAAHKRAEDALREKRFADDVSSAAAIAALEREFARVKVARRHRSRTGR